LLSDNITEENEELKGGAAVERQKLMLKDYVTSFYWFFILNYVILIFLHQRGFSPWKWQR
jgi:hypothetical protein